MPKLKTHKATAKRFGVSGSGRILRPKGHKSHLRRKKAARAQRQFTKMLPTSPGDARRVRKLIPYGA